MAFRLLHASDDKVSWLIHTICWLYEHGFDFNNMPPLKYNQDVYRSISHDAQNKMIRQETITIGSIVSEFGLVFVEPFVSLVDWEQSVCPSTCFSMYPTDLDPKHVVVGAKYLGYGDSSCGNKGVPSASGASSLSSIVHRISVSSSELVGVSLNVTLFLDFGRNWCIDGVLVEDNVTTT